MSGLKRSNIRYEAELKARRDALRHIYETHRSIDTLRRRIEILKKEIPEGVLGSFPKVEQMINRWLKIKLPAYQEIWDSQRLKEVEIEYRKIEELGKEVFGNLLDIKEIKKDEKAKEIVLKSELARNRIFSIEKLMQKWRPGLMEILLNTIEKINLDVKNYNFVEAEKGLIEFEKRFLEIKKQLNDLELQDELRWYTLRKLRKIVTEELGWGEEIEPKLLDEKNPSSPIFYEVNTYSNGRIRFWLELEAIRVNSEITNKGNLCMGKFDELSETLKEFGVWTKFEHMERVPSHPTGEMGKAKSFDQQNNVESKVESSTRRKKTGVGIGRHRKHRKKTRAKRR